MLHRILVVDDDLDIRESMADALSDDGYDVCVAANGREALDIMHACAPCVVILDLMMPVMDGWQVAARMEGDPALAAIPLCVVSAWPDRAPERCACVLGKPVSLRDLVRAVRNHCAPATHA